MDLKKLFLPCIYIYHGLLAVFKFVVSFFKYLFLGIIYFPILLIQMFSEPFKLLNKKTQTKKTVNSNQALAKNNQIPNKTITSKKDELLIQAKAEAIKKAQAEEELRNKINEEKEKKSEKELNEYLSDSSKLAEKSLNKKESQKKPTIFSKIWNVLNHKVGESNVDQNINRPELVINFEGPDAIKSKEKQTYEYIIRTPEGKVVKNYFDAFSKVEVHSFLKSQGNIVYSIKTSKWINIMHSTKKGTHDKFKIKDLIFLLAQLSTYLKAGIPLAESINILIKQFPSKKYKTILGNIEYDLTTGKSFSEALAKQGEAFPNILINMVKTSEMTGELPETLDDMEEYFSELEATRKAMVTAMMYPLIIFVIALGVGIFIMLYVVPKFIEIYKTMDNAKIPWITLAVLGLSSFLQKYIIYIAIMFVVILVLFIYLYKNVKSIRTGLQWFAMHIPVFGNVIIYNEVTTFTKTFASLLSHNVFITDSMDILNKVTNNEIYRELIFEAINNIAKGQPISKAFKDQWAFPIPAYEMIVTGEKTGQLPEMLKKVSLYYQDLHRNSVARIKTFVEPILIILLTVMVGVIVLSIVIPMFSMYSQIQT